MGRKKKPLPGKLTKEGQESNLRSRDESDPEKESQEDEKPDQVHGENVIILHFSQEIF